MKVNEITDSKFNAWRACIGIILLDKVVTDSERNWVNDRMKTIAFTDEQKNILSSDLKNGLDLNQVLTLVTDNKDKAFLVDMIRYVGNLDKNFSNEEREVYKKIEKEILGNKEFENIEKNITNELFNQNKINIKEKESTLEIISNYLFK